MQAEIETLFDRVHVVSLPRSEDRRSHIRQHFAELGLTRFSFFDAIDAVSPEVAKAYESAMVATFPPCFRCGKNSCGQDDCNNVLIAPQVANFLTYLRLWRQIAATPQRALVVEDDVVFQASAAETLRHLEKARAAGQFVFRPEVPKLLRLGWALGDDHAPGQPFRLDPVVRMSNPCHGMTSAFAGVLLERFTRIDRTSDLFLHRAAPRRGEALTVFPPLASELSGSVGAIASLIHPNPLRTAYLRQQGQDAAAQDNERLLHNHQLHMIYRP